MRKNVQRDFSGTMPPKRKRRILKEFVVHEISAVDRPAMRSLYEPIIKSDTQEIDMNTPATFEDAVDLYKARGLDGMAAMQQAARRFPTLLKSYNEEGAEIAKRRPEPGAQSEQAVIFEDLVDTIAKSRGVSRLEARRQAAREVMREDPAAFEAYRRA